MHIERDTSTTLNKEQVADLLHQVPDEQVRIWQEENQDCHIVIAAAERDKAGSSQTESQGAKIARVLGGILDHETAEMVRKNRQDFRLENWVK